MKFMYPMSRIFLIPSIVWLTGCVYNPAADAPPGMAWYHEHHGFAVDAPEEFAKARPDALAAYNRVLAQSPTPNLVAPPPPVPTTYELAGSASHYGTYGQPIGTSTYIGTARPRASTNFVDAYNQGKYSAMQMQQNELAMAPVYAYQAKAKQSYIAVLESKGWKLRPKR